MTVSTLPFVTEAEQQAAIEPTVHHLRGGGLIACPTDTVYGFGGALDDHPLNDLVRLKQRGVQRPFLLLLPGGESPGLQWTPAARALARAFWPGPLTLALRTSDPAFPPQVRSPDGTVAVRVPGHPGIAALVRAFGRPVTSTSANLAGEAPARDAGEVRDVLRQAGIQLNVLLLDGGRLPPSPPSTIVDCSTDQPRVVRAGAISTEAVENIIHERET